VNKESLYQFIAKLREKNQTPEQQEQAASTFDPAATPCMSF
jgi:hypothetical protein